MISVGTGTLTFDTSQTFTTLCTDVDNDTYAIDLSNYNFKYYDYATNTYNDYETLYINTNGMLGFTTDFVDDSIRAAGANNKFPTNSIRYYSMNAISTLKYYISNNTLFISAVGNAFNNSQHNLFTIVMKITQEGIFSVYYTNITGGGREPIIGWVGDYIGKEVPNLLYSTFDGTQPVNINLINNKLLLFDFRNTTTIINEELALGVTLSALFNRGITYEQFRTAGIDAATLNDNGITCFLQGSKILTKDGYIPIEHLRKGDLIKTYKHGFVPLEIIGKSIMFNPNNKLRCIKRLFKYTNDVHTEIIEELVITGGHSVLVEELTQSQIERTIEYTNKEWLQKNVIDDKQSLLAVLDERSEPYDEEGIFVIWHLALENENDLGRYGIYANGLLVETCCKDYLLNHSNMQIC
jgi:hypothetical protein